jgi:hypothetical protein
MDIYTLFFLDSHMGIAGMTELAFHSSGDAMAEADILCGTQFDGMEVWRSLMLIGRILRPGYIPFDGIRSEQSKQTGKRKDSATAAVTKRSGSRQAPKGLSHSQTDVSARELPSLQRKVGGSSGARRGSLQ